MGERVSDSSDRVRLAVSLLWRLVSCGVGAEESDDVSRLAMFDQCPGGKGKGVAPSMVQPTRAGSW